MPVFCFQRLSQRQLPLAVALPVLLCCANVCSDDSSPDVNDIVSGVGDQAIRKDGVTGLVIGVARKDSIPILQAFGSADVEHDTAVSPQTVFRIGSLTKQFTAAAVLLLAEEGRLHPDDPLKKHLPDCPAPANSVTLRQLLQHTSGLRDFTRLPNYRFDRQTDVSADEVLKRFISLPPDFAPGTRHQYCNSGYFLLGLVIEKVSGKSYREFIEERLLKPAGMKQSLCDDPYRIVPRRASGYSRWGGKLRNASYVSLKQSVGAGNMAATAGDLLLWQQALIDHRVLSKESFQQMITKGRLNNEREFAYGMGVHIRQSIGKPVIRHAGGISGFRSDLAWYPESGFIIVVLANCDFAKTQKISDNIARRLHTSLPAP